MRSPPFLSLREGYGDPVEPARFSLSKLKLRFYNEEWAQRVGLGNLDDQSKRQYFGELRTLPENITRPQALRYHGHQFRHYNPDLGDGRGFLLAQVFEEQTSRWLDLGTKGSGRTPYSRSADGRLTLKGAVREALATEMLESLGVNTSKTFCFFETGESLERHDEPSPTRSAVLTRLSHSHWRIGSFQRLAFYADRERLQELVDHLLHFYFGQQLKDEPASVRVEFFLSEVSRRVGRMCAEWMLAGFVHGVLNTDNISVTGESFDYGPWRFLPTYRPDFVAAYFDHSGLYAYGRQPESVGWALEQLAGALTLIAPAERLERSLEGLSDGFNSRARELIFQRFGVAGVESRAEELLNATFAYLLKSQSTFERMFYDWYGGLEAKRSNETMMARDSYGGPEFDRWKNGISGLQPIRSELLIENAAGQSAKFSSLLIEDVEAVWGAIAERDDWTLFEEKIETIRRLGHWYGFRSAPLPR